ncbi:MAG: ATP-binding protein [Acidobacteriota bacterium]|nr:ATP-binding protein [Acidobacteriota bacterium]
MDQERGLAKFFNTSGPCIARDHYMIEPWMRFERQKLLGLVDNKRYFILHAPRQTGKTTMMRAFARHLTAEGRYAALYVNIEAAQSFRNDAEKVNKVILSEMNIAARLGLPENRRPRAEHLQVQEPGNGIREFLTHWCLDLDRPLVLFIDEIDALIGDGLLSVLRQLRAGYNDRPESFPLSVCLIGVRDIRDYRIFSEKEQRHIVGGSAFNIKEKSLVLENFAREHVAALYGQHTRETGQEFEDAAVDRAFHVTDGQPWLVNALGRELCFEDPPAAEGKTVTAAHVDAAVERLIRRRDVHLDQLADKLTEPRVARVIQDILLSGQGPGTGEITSDDRQYVLDLGLIRKGRLGWEIANPIYREVVPRELTSVMEDQIGQDPGNYVTPEGKLDLEKLLAELVVFYRRHHELITRRKTYTEAAHHLVFLAWLHRVVNGGGSIEREYAVGLDRMDLHIRFGGEEFAVELKLHHKNALAEGKEQLAGYLERLGLDHGYLILFRRSNIQDVDRIGAREEVRHKGRRISVIVF